MSTKLFPTIIIILMSLSSGVYLTKGNYKMFIYWLAAAILNAAVTY